MIRELMLAGLRLSGKPDPRLRQGLAWTTAEAFWAAAMYPWLYLLLQGALTSAAIAWCALGMLLCLGLRVECGRRGMPTLYAGAYAMMGEARLRVADHLRQLPMGWHARQRGGDLGARLTSDLELIEHIWSHFIGAFVVGIVTPLCLMAFLAWLDWRMALLALAGLPPALLALALTQRAASRPAERVMSASAAAQSALLEYLQGIAVLRVHGRFGWAWQRLEQTLDELHGAVLAVESKPTPWLVSFGFLLEAGYVALVLVGAQWMLAGELDAATLLAFLVIVLPVYRHLFDAGLAVMLLRFSRKALQRIEALLAEPALAQPQRPALPQGSDIRFEQVDFQYEGAPRPALQGVSCTIAANSLTAIVGPSGAGKSTLVHLIARLWDVSAGSIHLGNADLRAVGSDELQRHVGMVFQDVVLFSGTVLENLRLGRAQATREEIVAAARQAQAHAFIEALPQGYDTVLDEGGASLSGGERQRLAIARALLKNAPILLLDEATANVDPSAEVEIQRALRALTHGRTVVAIAHRLHSVRHADQILVLDQGRLVEQGAHDQLLLRSGLYARLWERQMEARLWTMGAP